MTARFFLKPSFTGPLLICDRRRKYQGSLFSESVEAGRSIAEKAIRIFHDAGPEFCLGDVCGWADERHRRFTRLRARRALLASRRREEEFWLSIEHLYQK